MRLVALIFFLVFMIQYRVPPIYGRPNAYFVAPTGDDVNSGSELQPWRTVRHALQVIKAGDILYLRSGVYDTIYQGWRFDFSGTEFAPITVTNYPGEQVIFKINQRSEDYPAFLCWKDDYVNYVRVIGTDVKRNVVSGGIQSSHGIVILGPASDYTLSSGFHILGCDYWEVAGVDFINVGSAIFALKDLSDHQNEINTEYWYVHHNRVYGFYAESGMQFNGDNNRIEANEIFKVHDRHYTPWGCQHINLLGFNNLVRWNIISEHGSLDECHGILLEWDLADNNLIEGNQIWNVDNGVVFMGGDNNLLMNNLIITNREESHRNLGIMILSTDNRDANYCNSEPPELLPANDPATAEYYYYYEPRNCHSYGNQLYSNVIYGYSEGIRLFDLVSENTIVRNNVIAAWEYSSICYYYAADGTCLPLPPDLIIENNTVRANPGFLLMAVSQAEVMADAGETQVTYTVTYSNPGTEAANNVILTDNLPPEAKLLNCSGNCSGTGPIIWNIGTVLPGTGGCLTLTVTLPPATFATAQTNTVVLVYNDASGSLFVNIEIVFGIEFDRLLKPSH